MTPTAEQKFNARYNHMKTALQQSGSLGRDIDHQNRPRLYPSDRYRNRPLRQIFDREPTSQKCGF